MSDAYFLLLLLFVAGGLQIASACDEIPSGQTFRIRLLEPVASYSSKAGSPLRGVLIESPECEGTPIFPVGAEVTGTVVSVRRVGLGVRHETAALEMEFDRVMTEDGVELPMRARVLQVDNARETVRHGIVRGVRITETPQGFLTTRLIHLPTWNPDAFWILTARRAIFPVFPEPEIYFPPGTDLLLQLAEPMDVTRESPLPSESAGADDSEDAGLDDLAHSFPTRTQTSKGRLVDVVNVAFIGTQAQLESAFRSAGWSLGDPVSLRAISRQFLAVLSLRSYSAMPMEKQWVDGKPNDTAWQKSLDSYGKRDHLRIWSAGIAWQDEPVWFSSSTHDRSAVLSVRRGFVHRVDSDIDDERDKIVRDLSLAGCVQSVHETARPDMPAAMPNGTGDTLLTDDAISIVQLRDCTPASFMAQSSEGFALPSRPPSRVERYFRTQILSFRSDIWRSNAIYVGVQLTRQGVRALRNRQTATARVY